MRLALIHYAAPPIIGGVERVIEQQALILAKRGHQVVVFCGNEGATLVDSSIPVRVHSCLKAGAAATAGQLTADFAILEQELTSFDVAIIHNMLTMPFSAAAALALAEASRRLTGTRFINWVHDFDISRETFLSLDATVQHIAVSTVRQKGFCERMNLTSDQCPVIPNGVDVSATLGLTPDVAAWAERYDVWQHEWVLLHPTRILARKNLELGLAVVAVLRAQGKDVLYVVTGAPDPHRKESAAYATRIQSLILEWDLQETVRFVSESFPVTSKDVASLYRLADALFFPSKSEGFGLPLVEATLHRLPLFCSDIPPHREVAREMAEFFDLEAD
ncbi:MAG: glycosyltransferase family 4 protein, partial [Verrucomicrobium sp.]